MEERAELFKEAIEFADKAYKQQTMSFLDLSEQTIMETQKNYKELYSDDRFVIYERLTADK